MKEQIDTIPVNEAFEADGECPFCHLERQAEQRAMRYTLGPGASYMEPDVRAVTDSRGFCRQHFKKMYDYGNALGNALVMQTYFVGLLKELEYQTDTFQMPGKKGFLSKKPVEETDLLKWAKQKTGTCFLCDKLAYNMNRYYVTFFYMIKDPEFRAKVESSKGFCMHHFAQLLEAAREKLPNAQREWFYETVCSLMQENLARVQGDLDWFVDKFDYRNAGASWKNSRDAVPRSMQKLQGGYPEDEPYKEN